MAGDKKLTYVYRISCVKNNSHYVGVTSNYKLRIRMHFSEIRRAIKDGKRSIEKPLGKFEKDFKRYGRKNFIHEILFEFTDKLEALEKERELYLLYPSVYNREAPNGIKSKRENEKLFAMIYKIKDKEVAEWSMALLAEINERLG